METTYVVYVEYPRRILAYGEYLDEVVAFARLHYPEEIVCFNVGVATERLAEQLRDNPLIMKKFYPVFVGKYEGFWVLGTEEDMMELLKQWDMERENAPFQWVLYQEHCAILGMGRTVQEAFDDYLSYYPQESYESVLIELLEETMFLGFATPELAKEIESSGGDTPWSELGTFSGFPVLGTDEEYEEREGLMEI